jgi:hypothetical protein
LGARNGRLLARLRRFRIVHPQASAVAFSRMTQRCRAARRTDPRLGWRAFGGSTYVAGGSPGRPACSKRR